MGYLLRMSGEIHDWLKDLHRSDPPAALLTGQALAALMSGGASIGPPVVIPMAGSPRPAELREALDRSYQYWLEQLQVERFRVAEAARLVKDLESQVGELESAQARLDEQRRAALDAGRTREAAELAGHLATAQDQADEVRRLLAGATEASDRLSEEYQRRQMHADAFRTRKEVLKARYDVARASLLIHEAIATSGQATSASGQAAGSLSQAGDDGESQPEDPDQAITEAEAELRDITGEIERELRQEAWPEGLLELRPGALAAAGATGVPGATGAPSAPPGATGAPGDSEIRILFAVEPPGTALLISVLEGGQAVRDQYREAVMLSADVLRRTRAGLAPEAAAYAYGNARSFIDEFFPGAAEEVDRGAAGLGARNRAHSLAEQRHQLGLTQAEVARRMGVPPEKVSAIERAEAGATEVGTLASYVEALGGQLEIVAEFGPERVLLR